MNIKILNEKIYKVLNESSDVDYSQYNVGDKDKTELIKEDLKTNYPNIRIQLDNFPGVTVTDKFTQSEQYTGKFYLKWEQKSEDTNEWVIELYLFQPGRVGNLDSAILNSFPDHKFYYPNYCSFYTKSITSKRTRESNINAIKELIKDLNNCFAKANSYLDEHYDYPKKWKGMSYIETYKKLDKELTPLAKQYLGDLPITPYEESTYYTEVETKVKDIYDCTVTGRNGCIIGITVTQDEKEITAKIISYLSYNRMPKSMRPYYEGSGPNRYIITYSSVEDCIKGLSDIIKELGKVLAN